MPYMMSYSFQKKSKKLPVFGIWPDGNIAKALEAVLSREVKPWAAVSKFDVPRTTLQRCVAAQKDKAPNSNFERQRAGRRCMLEILFAERLVELAERGFPLTICAIHISIMQYLSRAGV